jgi:protein-tyrosine phosphatase
MKILIVCLGNAYRSPLAEALLKKLRPDLKVDSAGLQVATPISMEVRDFLRKRNAVQYLKDYPQSLDEKNLKDYDLIVAMDPKVKGAISGNYPNCKEKIIGWNIRDPYFYEKDTIKIFNKIEKKVADLAESLQTEKKV